MRTRNRRMRAAGRRLLMGVGSAAAPAWTPASLASLAAWYTAGPTWCFTDAGGTVACADGDPVRVWKDRSTNGRNLVQATSGNRPTLRLVSGVWVVRYDGVDDFHAATSFTLVQPEEVWAVFKVLVFSGSRRLYDGNANNSMGLFQALADGTMTVVADAAGNMPFQVPGSAVNTREIYDTLYSGASSRSKVNNGADVTGTVGTDSASGFKLGCNGAINVFSNVEVSEVAISSAAAGSTDRASMLAYLNAAWGVF